MIIQYLNLIYLLRVDFIDFKEQLSLEERGQFHNNRPKSQISEINVNYYILAIDDRYRSI